MNENSTNHQPRDGCDKAWDADDPRWTAYLLGELDAAEQAVAEQQLGRSEACRAAVDEIRNSVEAVTAGLATEPGGELSSSKRRRLERAAAARDCSAKSPWPIQSLARFTNRRRATAAAVSLAIGALLVSALQPAKEAARSSRPSVAMADRSSSMVRSAAPAGREARRDRTIVIPNALGASPAEVMPKLGARADFATLASSDAGKKRFFDPAIGGIPAPNGAPGMVPPGFFDVGRYEYRVSNGLIQTQGQRVTGASMGTSLDDPYAFSLDGQHPRLPQPEPELNTESYARIFENPFLDVRQNPLSTFSIDVDTASYANVRRLLNQNTLPPKDAVRIEELVNYFKYHYAPPEGDAPFAVHADVAGCPWNAEHRLLRVAIQGRPIDVDNRPAGNLVFLVDVSGSMDSDDKLPLLKRALRLLIDKLGENDRVAVVVYAGASGLVLPSTTGDQKALLGSAIDNLQAGGSTNGGEGIQLAYDVARRHFIRGGTNRVILCTDGDFNVGITDEGSLTRLIENDAKSGVFLSVLGFGSGNLKDATMEKLADRGNGNYAYIDGLAEARKVLVEQLGGTLVTIAKDVKLQLEFNPSQVAAYRLVGYENRLLRTEDFDDDRKDAGEIGAGHTVTAFYELVPSGRASLAAEPAPLKYQRLVEPSDAAASGETLTLKLRYKDPDGQQSKLLTSVVRDSGGSYAEADVDFRFAAAVAAFGLALRDSEFKGNATLAAVLELARAAPGADEGGYRSEFVELVRKAQTIQKQRPD